MKSMQQAHTLNTLILTGLEIYVHLGATHAERSVPQRILLDLRFLYNNMDAAISDQLNDALCYANLQSKLQEKVSTHQYNLIEYLANTLFQFLCNADELQYDSQGKKNVQLQSLTLHKHPPMSQLHQASIHIEHDKNI